MLQQNLRELRPIGWLSLAGLLASAGILIYLLWREIRTTRRLLARTEESRDRIEHLAHHDALTGLPNRRLFEDRLIQALAVAARARRRLALLYLDLDGFKEINDTLGHRAGDELLKVVAERLATTVRGGDTIARLGGDEFAVIQVELRSATDAAVLAERLMAAAAKPMRIGQQDVVIGASVGIALYPRRRRHRRRAARQRRRGALQRQDRRPGAHGLLPPRAHHGGADPRRCCAASSRAASRTASSSCTTSPRSPPPTARSPAWRRCCAGSTRSAALLAPRPFCRWPRRPG